MNTNETKRKSVKPSTKVKILAALLMAGAVFTACSSDNNINAEQSTEPQVYTMVIKALKDGARQEQNGTRSSSAEGSDAMTRALRLGTDSETGKNAIEAYWSGNETFDVVQYAEIIGTATAAASETNETTITVTMTKAPDPSNGIYFYINGAIKDYTGQVGLLTGTNSISEKYDYAEAYLWAGKYTVNGYDVIPNDGVGLIFLNLQSILKFTLVDNGNNDAAINATKLNIHSSAASGIVQKYNVLTADYTRGDLTITPDGTTNEIYVATIFSPNGDLTLTANDGNGIYSYTTTDSPSFIGGRYYEITANMNKILAKVSETNASAVLAGGYTAITADHAAELAKQCWTVAGVEGATVYVVYSISGTTVNYVKTVNGETTDTGTATGNDEFAALYGGNNTAWIVDPPAGPKPIADATFDDVAKVVGADGYVYDDVDAATAAGTTAVAKIANVNNEGRGLALALNDDVAPDGGTFSWDDAITAAAAHTPTVAGCTWKLPSDLDWSRMGATVGVATILCSTFNLAGDSARYWSSTPDGDTDGDMVNIYEIDNFMGKWITVNKSEEAVSTRACLTW